MNGYARDTRRILELNFPTFSYGSYAQDQAPRGRVIDFRTSIEIEAVSVKPGDIVVGDIDGACIVPKEHEEEIFFRRLKKPVVKR